MQDLFIALALALVLEGLLYAAFPLFMKRIIISVLQLPEFQLRLTGILVAMVGLFVLIWFKM